MEAGKFSSVDEVIDEALRLVEKRYQQADERTGQQLENQAIGPEAGCHAGGGGRRWADQS